MSDEPNQTTAKQESDLSIMSMITNRIGWQEVLLAINRNYDNIWEMTLVTCFHRKKQKKQKTVNLVKRETTACAHYVFVLLHRYDLLTVPLTVLLHCPITSITHTLSY